MDVRYNIVITALAALIATSGNRLLAQENVDANAPKFRLNAETDRDNQVPPLRNDATPIIVRPAPQSGLLQQMPQMQNPTLGGNLQRDDVKLFNPLSQIPLSLPSGLLANWAVTYKRVGVGSVGTPWQAYAEEAFPLELESLWMFSNFSHHPPIPGLYCLISHPLIGAKPLAHQNYLLNELTIIALRRAANWTAEFEYWHSSPFTNSLDPYWFRYPPMVLEDVAIDLSPDNRTFTGMLNAFVFDTKQPRPESRPGLPYIDAFVRGIQLGLYRTDGRPLGAVTYQLFGRRQF